MNQYRLLVLNKRFYSALSGCSPGSSVSAASACSQLLHVRVSERATCPPRAYPPGLLLIPVTQGGTRPGS